MTILSLQKCMLKVNIRKLQVTCGQKLAMKWFFMAEAKVSFRAETQVKQVSNIKHIYKLYPSI